MKNINFIIEILKLTKVYFLIFIILILSILEFVLGIGITYAEKILGQENLNVGIKYIVALVFLCLIIYIVEYFFNKKVYIKELQVNQTINKKILDSIVGKNYREIEKYGSDNILTLMVSDSFIVSGAFVSDFLKILSGLTLFVSATIFGFYCSVELTLFSLILCPISLIVPKYIGEKLECAWEKRQQSQEDMQTILLQIFNNKHIANIFHVENFLLNLLEKRYRKFANNQFESSKLQHIVVTLNVFFGLMFDIVLMCFSFYLISKNKLSIAEFLAFSVLLKNLTWLFYQFSSYFVSLKNSKVSYNRIKNFIVDIIEEDRKNYAVTSLNYNKISYSYDDTEKIIDNLDFSLNNKEKIVIYGESGVGKTTLLKLFLGLYNSNVGSVVINGEKEKNNISYSYVPQKIELFDLSLRENILLGRKIDDTSLEKILKITGVDEIVTKLAIKLDDNIKNINFSAGEKQKIALARALVESNILILDEPFANLDIESEKSIVAILENLDVATIIVSHRLENLKNFNFYELKNGKLRRA